MPLLREINQWVIGCDNLRNCHALSTPSGVDEEDYSSLTLHIWHQAGPEGYLRLRFDHRGLDVDLSNLLLDSQPLGLELTREFHMMPRCTGVSYGNWPLLWSTLTAP